MTRNWKIASLAGLALVVVIAVLLWPRQATEKVRMGYLPMISSLTYFVAVDQGYFRDEKLDVEGIPIGTSDNMTKNLVNRDIDLAVELSIAPLIKEYIKSTSDTAPAGKSNFLIFSHSLIDKDNGFDSVLVLEKSAITDWRQLSGRKIGAFPGTTAERTILDVFKREFGSLPAPIVVTKPPTLQLSGLANGEFDALHTYEPFLTQGLIAHKFRRIKTSLYAEQMPLDASGRRKKSPVGVAAVNRKWADEFPDVALRAIAALDKATEFIEKYPDRAKLIAAKFTGTEPSVASAMNIMPMTQSNRMQPLLISDYLTILKNIGEVDRVPDENEILFEKDRR